MEVKDILPVKPPIGAATMELKEEPNLAMSTPKVIKKRKFRLLNPDVLSIMAHGMTIEFSSLTDDDVDYLFEIAPVRDILAQYIEVVKQ